MYFGKSAHVGSEKYLFTVNQINTMNTANMSLKDMIITGNYDWVNPNITEENFPMPENLVIGSEPKLFHFYYGISSDTAIKKMDNAGYRPATIWDLLDFGAKNPKEQRVHKIVALRSVASVNGYLSVVYLSGNDHERDLRLDEFNRDWNDYYRFLAVRK